MIIPSSVRLIEFSEEQKAVTVTLSNGGTAPYLVQIQPNQFGLMVAVETTENRSVMSLFTAQSDGTFALEWDPNVSLSMRCVRGDVWLMQICSLSESLVVCVSKIKSGAYEGWLSSAIVH